MRTVPDLPPEDSSRFSDMFGYIFSADDPPTLHDAAGYLWRAWWSKERDEMPTAEEIYAVLERLQELYAQGKWRRG